MTKQESTTTAALIASLDYRESPNALYRHAKRAVIISKIASMNCKVCIHNTTFQALLSVASYELAIEDMSMDQAELSKLDCAQGIAIAELCDALSERMNEGDSWMRSELLENHTAPHDDDQMMQG